MYTFHLSYIHIIHNLGFAALYASSSETGVHHSATPRLTNSWFTSTTCGKEMAKVRKLMSNSFSTNFEVYFPSKLCAHLNISSSQYCSTCCHNLTKTMDDGIQSKRFSIADYIIYNSTLLRNEQLVAAEQALHNTA